MYPLESTDPAFVPVPGALPGAVRTRPCAPHGWRVVKLGGTTAADTVAVAAALRHVSGLAKRKRVAVVVSALAGVTDTICRWVDAVRHGRTTGMELAELARKHHRHLGALVETPPAAVAAKVDGEIASLHGLLAALYRGGEAAEELRILALSIGERLAAHLLCAAFRQGSEHLVERVDASWLLVADGPADAAVPDLDSTRRRTAGYLASSRADVWVVPGFFAQDPLGRPRLLGRGGSDTSATLLGAALAADRVEIWTDVDGVYTADPRRDPAARRFERLDFDHAERLAHGGARVLHPRSIAPARAAGVPILVRNALGSGRRGTWIEGVEAPLAEPGAGRTATGRSPEPES